MSSGLFDLIVRELRHAALAAGVFVAVAPNIGAQAPDVPAVQQDPSRDELASRVQNENVVDALMATNERKPSE